VYFYKIFFVMEEEVKVKVQFTLEHATKTKSGSRAVALILTLERDGSVRSMPTPSRLTPENVAVLVVQEAGRVPELFWRVR
jgi:hypothetical protein